MKNELLFQVWPYAAFVLFCVGLATRYVAGGKRRSGSISELREARSLFRGRLWRFGFLALLLGHLAGLLFPDQILLWNSVTVKLYLLEGFAFASGLAALAGWVVLIWRQLAPSRGTVLSQSSDAIFLALLLVALLSGLVAAGRYRWASSWGVLTLTPYARSVLRGQPVTALAAGMPFLVQLHVVSALAALAALPFTRLALLLLARLRRGLGFVFKPVVAFTRLCRRTLEAWLQKHHPTLWIWPEED